MDGSLDTSVTVTIKPKICMKTYEALSEQPPHFLFALFPSPRVLGHLEDRPSDSRLLGFSLLCDLC